MSGFRSARRLFIAFLLTAGAASARPQEAGGGPARTGEVILHPLAARPQGPAAGTEGPRSAAIREMENFLKEKGGVFGYNAAAYGATFRRDGVEVVIPKALPGLGEPRLAYRFLGLRRGNGPTNLPAVSRLVVRAEARALGFLRGDVEERYVLLPESLEQVFVLGKIPRGSGDLELVGAVTGNLAPPSDGTRGGRLSFTHQGQEAMYVSDAVAIDAAGARLPLELVYSRGQVSIVVPEEWLAKAALPLVIDPIVGSRIAIDSSAALPPGQVQGMDVRRIDVACGSGRNEWLAVWSERFGSSSFDYDVWGQRVSATGALVGSPINVSASTSGDYDLTISYAPGVDRYLVAWRHDPADNASDDDQRIHGRVLNGDGTFFTGVFTLDDRPGQDFGPSAAFDGANWYVAFGSGSSNPDVRGRFVSPDGVPGVAADPDTEGDFAGRPSVDVLAGTYLVAWEKGSASSRRVHARTMDPAGSFRTGITLVSQGAGAATQPDVSAGDRGKFLLVWRDEGSGLIMGRRATPLLSFPENAFTVSNIAGPYGSPRVAYAPAMGSWYVVYYRIDTHESSQDVYGTQVAAGGVPLPGPPERVAGGAGAQVYPEIAWNPTAREMLVAYASIVNREGIDATRVSLVSASDVGPSEPRDLAQFRADGATPVPPGGSVPESSVILKARLWNLATFDDFEDRNYTDNPSWSIGAGSWHVLMDNGASALVDQGSQADEWIYTTAPGIQSYGIWIYRFRWMQSFASGENRQAHFYLFMNTPALAGDGYFVLVTAGSGSTRTVSLYRTQGGAVTRLIGTDANWTFDTQFHTLKVIRGPGNEFSLYLDDALIGTATDGTFSTAGAMIVRHVANTTHSLGVDHIWTSAAAGARTLKLQVEVKPAGVPFDWITGLSASGFVGNGTLASVSVPNLRTGRYHWQAVAIDDAGKESIAVPFGGNPETEADFEVLLQAPANFRGTALSPGSILWEWEDIGEENGYVVHDEAHATLGTTGPSVLSWTESQGLSENAPYSRHVHAVNAQGEGPASNAAVRYTRVHDPAAADFALTVVSSNRIDVAVAPPPNSAAGLTACRIERSSDGANWTAPPVKSFDEPGYSKSDTGLAPETTYYYRIAYRNGDGVVTAASPVRSATTLPLPPPAPTGLSAEPGDRQVTLRWNAVAQATGYRVKRSLVSGGPYDTVADGVTATSWTDANLVNGVRYHYVVTATNPGGESPPSGEASATPGVPPPPTNLAARVERGIVTLTWDASPGATSYNVYRGTSAGGPYPTPVASGVTGTSATDAPDVSGTTCYYIVTGRNLYGEGLPSNEASAFIPPRPLPPANVRTISYANAVDVEWDPSPTPDVAGYNVYRKLESDPVWPTVPLNGDRLILNTRYRDGTVVAGLRYVYRVTAVGR